MDKYIDARFDRVEKALVTLIDSIAKYNPSVTQASELATADRELGKGLEQLQTHQNNHLRLQALRAQTNALDAQIKETLTVLAATRRDITSTTITSFPEKAGYDIYYDELLRYARRISKFTMPPAGVTNGVDLSEPGVGGAGGGATGTPSPAIGVDTPGSGHQTPAATPSGAVNGVQTPGAGPMQTTQTTQASETEPVSQGVTATTTTGVIPEPLAAFLNPLTGTMFVPWPGEDKIRMGSLAKIQELSNAGVDPRGFDPEEEARQREQAERDRREAEERERLAQEETERRMREDRERRRLEQQRLRETEELEGFRRASVVIGAGGALPGAGGAAAGGPGTAAAAPEKKQFQFMGDIDDDDDEDD